MLLHILRNRRLFSVCLGGCLPRRQCRRQTWVCIRDIFLSFLQTSIKLVFPHLNTLFELFGWNQGRNSKRPWKNKSRTAVKQEHSPVSLCYTPQMVLLVLFGWLVTSFLYTRLIRVWRYPSFRRMFLSASFSKCRQYHVEEPIQFNAFLLYCRKEMYVFPRLTQNLH